jgi:hypothetical protein
MTTATDTPAATPTTSPPAKTPPAEPFGQTGIRQYILPALAAVSFTLACAAAIMWFRSSNTADILARRDGAVTFSVRSIYGRIVVTRADLRDADVDDVPGIPVSSGGWQYGMFEVPDSLPDGWRESWRKSIGVEWQDEALFRHPSVVGGWWLRVRWRTITLLAMAPPITIAIVHDLRQRRRRKRPEGFAVATEPSEAPEATTS